MAPVGPSVRDWSADARAQDSRLGAHRIDRDMSYSEFSYDYLKAGTEGMIRPSIITKRVRVVKKLVRRRIVSIGLPGSVIQVRPVPALAGRHLTHPYPWDRTGRRT